MKRLADGFIVAGAVLIVASVLLLLVELLTTAVSVVLALSLGIGGGLAAHLGGRIHTRLVRQRNRGWRS